MLFKKKIYLNRYIADQILECLYNYSGLLISEHRRADLEYKKFIYTRNAPVDMAKKELHSVIIKRQKCADLIEYLKKEIENV